MTGSAFGWALIANGERQAQRAKIDRFELGQYFHYILVEGEFGSGKPDARVYWAAMKALGSQPSNTWMIGDNLEWEVAAPRRIGLAAIWINTSGDGVPAGTLIQPNFIAQSGTEVLSIAQNSVGIK